MNDTNFSEILVQNKNLLKLHWNHLFSIYFVMQFKISKTLKAIKNEDEQTLYYLNI